MDDRNPTKDFLRNRDLFGHPIELNYNRKGSAHQTSIGGFFSIIVRCVYTYYLSVLVRDMLTFDDDKTFEHTYTDDHSQLVGYDEVGVLTYNALYRFVDEVGFEPLFYDAETQRYIEIKYAQMTADFGVRDGKRLDGMYKYKYFPAQ